MASDRELAPLPFDIDAGLGLLRGITGKENPIARVRLFYERHKNSAPDEWKAERDAHPAKEIVGTLTALRSQIEALQAQGYAAYLVLNAGNCAGDFMTDSDVAALRGFFTDRDGTPAPKAFHVEPNFFVRRDPMHDQAFWVAPTDNVSLFKPTQLRLAAYYGTDSAVCNPSRVTRLAGSWHLKTDKPILVTFEENPNCLQNSIGPYSPGDVVEGLPEISIADVQARAAASGVEYDKPAAISKFERYLQDLTANGKFAVMGQDGNPFTYKTVAKGKDWGLSPAKILETVATSDWNKGNIPQWDDDELTILIANVFGYGANEPGSDAPKHVHESIPTEAFNKLVEESKAGAAAPAVAPKNKSRFVLIPASDWATKLEPSTFLIEDFIPDKSSVLLYGPLSSYKSFLALAIAGSVASGEPAFKKLKVNRKGHVILAVGEQPNATGKVRFPAWAADCKQTLADLPLTLVPAVPLLGDLADIEDFVATIKPLNPVLVVIDTLSKAMAGLDFNSPKDGIVAGERIRQIVEALDCVVIVIGHSGKDIKRGLLGSVLVSANIDAIYVVERPVEKGPAVVVRNIRLRNSDERGDLYFRADKKLDSVVMNITTLSEFKSLTGAAGKRNALVAEIEGTLRAHGYIGTKTCSYTELLILMLTDRGVLENDPEIDKPLKRSLRKKIDHLRNEDKDETVLALGRKAKGNTAGLQWSAPALADDDETEGDLGSLDDAQ